jgi:hypothetical protein
MSQIPGRVTDARHCPDKDLYNSQGRAPPVSLVMYASPYCAMYATRESCIINHVLVYKKAHNKKTARPYHASNKLSQASQARLSNHTH